MRSSRSLALCTLTLTLPLPLGMVALTTLAAADSAAAGTLSYSWQWPVDPPHVVTREFRAPATDYGPGHRGLDLAASDGTDVHAPAAGRVLFAGAVAGRGVVTIDHGDGVISTLEPVEATVSVGDPVSASDVIGHVRLPDVAWDSAHACACLHIGARERGEYVSPHTLLERARPSVLKPWGDGPIQ